MAVEILMPALSPTMTEGTLAKWLKKEGDEVNSGDVIAEIETDKATMEVEAVDSGTLAKIIVADGTHGVKVNQRIAVILEDGDSESDVKAILDKPEIIEASTKIENQENTVTTEFKENSLPQQNTPHHLEKEARIKASPLAKRIAKNKGIDLKFIKGTGPHGRIIKKDLNNVDTYPKNFRDPSLFHTSPHSNMRKVIAQRLVESKQQVPHFYLSVDCNVDDLLKIRSQINKEAIQKDGSASYKISVNDLVIKASAIALKNHPQANASWAEEGMRFYNNVDISVAVAIDNGLITPIIFNADHKNIVELSREMKSLASKAKDGKLLPEEFQGGSFTISNLGMYGIKQFNAIVNIPQSCILAVGATEEKATVKNGSITASNIMNLTLSCDHRVVDGALAATLLGSIKKLLENPVLMFI